MVSKTPSKGDLQARRRFAKRLKAARIFKGFETQKDFAGAVGLEDETYRRYERAETEPTIGCLIRMATKLEVTLDFLVAGSQGEPPPHIRVVEREIESAA
jgi:transcriptional regulator with XRE-family HTH domain